MTQQTTTAQAAEPTLTDLVDHLTRFDGPPDQFLLHLLAVQCHIGSAQGGTILRTRDNRETEVLAVYPAPQENQTAPVWLAQSVEAAPGVTKSTETVVVPLQSPGDFYDQSPAQHLIMIPLRSAEGVRGVAAFLVLGGAGQLLEQNRERLELTVSLLSLYEMRLTLQRRHADLQRLRGALEVLSSINSNARFKAAAMALCNEIASAWQAERVSLGFRKGRYIKAVAMSHTEKFTRKMKLVLDIESAMEECFDQDVEVINPPPPEATCVSRAAGVLSSKHGPTTVCSLPLRRDDKTIGVLTVERAPDQPFLLTEIESLRLVCELCTARVDDLHEHDKWFGAKLVDSTRKGLETLVGHEYTWLKALVIGVFLAAVFLIFARGSDYAKGPFEIQTNEQRLVPAPFPGYLDQVFVEPGDDVVADKTRLATLETRELETQLDRAVLERKRWMKLRDVASDPEQGNPADVQVAAKEIQKIDKQIDLLRYQIKQANLVAPMTGVVVAGDRKKEQGRPVEQGEELFRIAPLDALRAEILVPENRIAEVALEQTGDLAPVANPGTYMRFTVDRISPIAEIVNQQNVFRVRVRFDTDSTEREELKSLLQGLKPGSEGIARIEVGRAHYAWMWTRDMINWVRMKMWW